MVSVQALSKRFADRIVVDQVSLAAQPGEVLGLLGENGAGKTTTLRMLATILQPSAGDALVGGCSIVREPHRVRRQLGFLTADAGLYDRLTARENVQYFALLHGVDRATLNARTAAIFELLDLGAVADKPVGRFSKGMKQKVCLARAFVHDPPVLLLDEPSSGLDVAAMRAMEQFILQQKQAGKVILFSSHIMSEVEKLCDRVAVISRGRIVAEGTLDALRQPGAKERLEDVFLRLVGDRACD